jgi:hypothetical protein
MTNTPKQIKQAKENWDKCRTPEAQRRRSYRRMEIENNESDKLRKNGWVIYYPTTVCDRIGVKNNKVYFLEFKRKGQDLREGQKAISELTKGRYRIFYYD